MKQSRPTSSGGREERGVKRTHNEWRKVKNCVETPFWNSYFACSQISIRRIFSMPTNKIAILYVKHVSHAWNIYIYIYDVWLSLKMEWTVEWDISFEIRGNRPPECRKNSLGPMHVNMAISKGNEQWAMSIDIRIWLCQLRQRNAN